MTCKHTYICYPCMETRRAEPYQACRCPKCGNPMIHLHYKIRVPKKKRKLWIEFKEWLTTTYVYYKGKL